MNTKHYTGSLELKADAAGSFRATFASFNVVDRDGDVTTPGAFEDRQAVKIASWGHNWGALPVGKGTIQANRDKAWVDGQFFLDTAAGKEHYTTVKNLGDEQEWSYGFQVDKWSIGEFEGREVRFLEKLTVFEVSPVMLGAGIGTQTDSIKSLGMVKADDETVADPLDGEDAGKDDAGHEEKAGRRLSAVTMRRLRSMQAELADLLGDPKDDEEDDGKAADPVDVKTLTLSEEAVTLSNEIVAYLKRIVDADADTLQRDESTFIALKNLLTQAQDDIEHHLARAKSNGPTLQSLKRQFEQLARNAGGVPVG